MSETALDATLLSLLACPEDKGPLHLVRTDDGADVLYNPRLRRAYPIDNGIPVLLVDEAHTVDDAEHERLTDRLES
ncbi:Trm112 family protein [Nocardia brevicatena]|uniref:Trm112 family protein n=1 Tax=Nocardia brevicatena TaxID=37327 RepID=UPI0002D42013|nr:Trm112 family protein [Nocardia brevicatena]